jgi:ribonuclease P protein subunit POP4
MKIDRQNVVNHELIGLHATVVKSTNRDTVGLSGRVIDESRNLFTLESRGREKKAAKYGNTFEFRLSESDKVRIDGGFVVGRPEDRVAKRLRNWHNR